MILEREKPVKERSLKTVIIKSDGKVWDVEQKAPIECPSEYYDDCYGRCKWFSIDENGIAKCQNIPLGKIDSTDKKSRK